MKVILHVKGNNAINVKDKILSVLDVDYMEFDRITTSDKPTRFQRLQSMTIDEVAKHNIKFKRESIKGVIKWYHITSDGTKFDKDDFDKAVEHEKEWLSEVEKE
jgi:isocitrate dehydrogenase kinase/phosphatase